MTTTEMKIQAFMVQFKVTYMEASDWLFANDDDYNKAVKDYTDWLSLNTN